VQLQTSPSDWHARRARVILQARASSGRLGPAVRQQLRELFIKGANPDWRLRAMWTLHVTGLWTPDALIQIFDDSDEYIRAWAVQLITEDGTPSQPVLDTFLRLARDDRSPVVRLYLASALQRIAEEQRWPIASALMAHGEDADDDNLPKILWLAVEPLVRGNPAQALDYAGRSNIPALAQFIARRAVDADNAAAVVAEIGKAPKSVAALLEGLRDGLQGRVDVEAPAGWPAIQARSRRAGGRTAQLTAEVAQQFGDTQAVRRNLATIKNDRAATDDRKRALQVLAGQRRPQLVDELPAMLASPDLRMDAIRAVAAFDNDRLGRLLVERYADFSAAERAEALQTMASRQRYGRMLTDAIAKGIVPRTDVPASLPRQLLRVVGTPFLDVWGPVERSATDERAYARYRAVLNDNAMARADLANGRTLFRKTCGSCHRLNGEGGTVGPDLTGTNRVNANWLLLNILEPNADVQDAYKLTVVTTRDGRTYSGSIAAETDRQLTLRVMAADQGRSSVAVNKADIQSRDTTAVSMMPPGLLDTLTDSEVVDLMAYVRQVETAPAATLRNRLH